MSNLTVEIYPPHPDCPIDMVHIWRRVQSFCDDLRSAPVIPGLSIYFKEDEIATWSSNGEANDTLKAMQWTKQPTNSDVTFILDLFARLTNVTKCTTQVPASLKHREDLQHSAKVVQDSVTKVHPLDPESVEVNYELMAEDVDENEYSIELATGRKSVAKLEAFYGNDVRLTYATLRKFQDLWPHMDEFWVKEHEGPERYLDWGPIHCTDNERLAESKKGKPPWV